jgi:hypothetical protein
MGAPSGYLGFIKDHPSNEIMQEICVPYYTSCTFYSLLNWNAGRNDEMAGYAGFQVLKNGTRTFHFSVWDPETTSEKPRAIQLNSAANENRFRNEKEGIKIIMPFAFEVDIWYRVRLSIQHPDEASTHIHCFIGRNTTEELVSVVKFPLPRKIFLSGYSSFIEDFCNTPKDTRKYYIGNGRSFDIESKKWHEWNQQRFSFNEADPNKAINAGVVNHAFFLESGGNTILQLPNNSILQTKS